MINSARWAFWKLEPKVLRETKKPFGTHFPLSPKRCYLFLRDKATLAGDLLYRCSIFPKALSFAIVFWGKESIFLVRYWKWRKKKTFEELGLREDLVKACDRLGWKNPSKIQSEALSYALQVIVFRFRCLEILDRLGFLSIGI